MQKKKATTALIIITLNEAQVLQLPLCANGAGAGAWPEGSEAAGAGAGVFFGGDGGLTASS